MDGYNRHNNRTELQVFICRLMITLPLLLAGYLFNATAIPTHGRLCEALYFLPCLCFLWNWCHIYPTMAVMFAMAWGLS